MTLKIAGAILSLMLILVPINSTANNDTKVKEKNEQLIQQLEELNKNPVLDMADKLEANKKELGLKYKNKQDLIETLGIIWKYTKNDDNFTFEQVVSIAIVESGLYQYSLNNEDKGKGIMMAMQKYWKKELPWYTNPYNKNQSVKAGVSILNIIKEREHCSSWQAIRYYNSKSYKSKKYIAKVKRVYSRLV
jgi:predicted  nucleic acid-binding Zn-ribbon protein